MEEKGKEERKEGATQREGHTMRVNHVGNNEGEVKEKRKRSTNILR